MGVDLGTELIVTGGPEEGVTLWPREEACAAEPVGPYGDYLSIETGLRGGAFEGGVSGCAGGTVEEDYDELDVVNV